MKWFLNLNIFSSLSNFNSVQNDPLKFSKSEYKMPKVNLSGGCVELQNSPIIHWNQDENGNRKI